jgi:hypothetical protein
MALFRHQVFMQIGTDRPWTNVWHVDAADLATAAAVAATVLAPGYAPYLEAVASVIRIITSTPGVPGAFIDQAFSIAGTAGGSGDLLPLFNTVRPIFGVGSGRNDSKFLRGLLTEGLQDAGVITPSYVTALASSLLALLGDMTTNSTPFCDTDLNPYTTVTVQGTVQERQRHRRRRHA